ncbi:MAG: hypothetical protein NTX28_04570 [Novosphingobium sp.]|nr:hypothetical protein [Novosphingobium sp.]
MSVIAPAGSPYRSPLAQSFSWWARYAALCPLSAGLPGLPPPSLPWQLAHDAIPRAGSPS